MDSNYSWNEYDISNLFLDSSLKTMPDIVSIIIRDDQITSIYMAKASSSNLLNSGESEVWTIKGFPIALYGRFNDIDRLYQELRRHLLGIVACASLTADGNAMVKMI